MSTIKETKIAYERFINNYHTENGGINLYPGYDKDLSIILDFIKTEFIGLDEVFE